MSPRTLEKIPQPYLTGDEIDDREMLPSWPQVPEEEIDLDPARVVGYILGPVLMDNSLEPGNQGLLTRRRQTVFVVYYDSQSNLQLINSNQLPPYLHYYDYPQLPWTPAELAELPEGSEDEATHDFRSRIRNARKEGGGHRYPLKPLRSNN